MRASMAATTGEENEATQWRGFDEESELRVMWQFLR